MGCFKKLLKLIGGCIISHVFSLCLVCVQSLGESSSDSDDCELRDTWIENFAKGAAGTIKLACSLVSKVTKKATMLLCFKIQWHWPQNIRRYFPCNPLTKSCSHTSYHNWSYWSFKWCGEPRHPQKMWWMKLSRLTSYFSAMVLGCN